MKTKLAVASLLIAGAVSIAGQDEKRCGGAHTHGIQPRSSDHNWIIERQEAYQIQGTPSARIISGGREIDVYSNGLMFEGGVVVGVKR